ncbi:MAG: glycoside hydrolase family 3 N-terminal domain-containing protein [Flavobacteriales bacterium]|nr:glycoside hydrolase family 3 N-terminal domain-containing protein [Flavobacteriales bacterium]
MNKFSLFIVAIVLFSCNSNNSVKSNKLDPKIENSITTILRKMSIEEKVGQTCQITLDAILLKDSTNTLVEPHQIDHNKLNQAIIDYNVGSILNVSNHTFSIKKWNSIIKDIQAVALKTNHKIPVIYGVDAIHGATYIKNSTLFPQEIGLAATWNLSHAKKMAEITAYETRASGVPWNFSPVLDLGRKPIWSRFFETLGEDVYLAKTFGTAIVDGYQGNQMIDSNHVVACLKHYVGYSYPSSGRDRTPSLIPNRTMEEYYLPPFKDAVDAGALTVMVNSGEVNGIPGHANKYLLTEVLKEKWGFIGFAVSDWEDFINLHKVAQTDSTLKDAIATAINAGVDMSMVPNNPEYKNYCNLLVELVREGRVSQKRLNDAVRRIIRVKYYANLFENSHSSSDIEYPKFGSEEFKKAAYNAASESVTLLKNNNDILPLSKDKSILVLGPTANSLNCLNGAWTHTWQGIDQSYNNSYPTIKEALEKKFKNVSFFEGSKMLMVNGDEADLPSKDLSNAVRAAKSSDVAIICVGELPSTERPGDIYSLDLPIEQQFIVKEISKTGIPIILVLVEGRPKIIREIEPLSNAILQAYLPGDQGGKVIADILAGDVIPSGKLPYTYPRHNGVLMYYDHKQSEVINANTWKNDFYNPQWDFGYGLSYSSFSYSNLKLSTNTLFSNDKLIVSVDVENTGEFKAKEVVQLYIRDHYASISPSLKKLKRFLKIELEVNETRTIEFSIGKDDLQFYGIGNNWITEDGKFSVMISNQSQDFNFKN